MVVPVVILGLLLLNFQLMDNIINSNDLDIDYVLIYKDRELILNDCGFDEDDRIICDAIVDNLESEKIDFPLSANQGKILKEEYLDSMKHIYLTEAEYAALMPVTIDAAGSLTVKETVADSSTEISIDDDVIIWNNKGLYAVRHTGLLILIRSGRSSRRCLRSCPTGYPSGYRTASG